MKRKFFATLLAFLLLFVLTSCKQTPVAIKKVGISAQTRPLQRWSQDSSTLGNLRQALIAAGYEVDLQYSNFEADTQISQLEDMIANGCEVLVVVAAEADSLDTVLADAKAKGIIIIAYDRFIDGQVDADYYLTFDDVKTGELQGNFVKDALDLDHAAGPFNIEFFAGDPGESNAVSGAKMYFDGAMSVLKPYIDSGKLVVSSGQIAFEQIATLAWSTEFAQARMEALIASEGYGPAGRKLDAVVCSNDSTAQGVIYALTAAGYDASNIPVITGQDCDIPNVKNMLVGLQSMSVFRDTDLLADRVFLMVDSILKGQEPEVNNTTFYVNQHTGKAIPTYVCAPIVCYNTEASIREILIDSGYYDAAEVGL